MRCLWWFQDVPINPIFTDLSLLKQNIALLAVFLNFLISNSEPAPMVFNIHSFIHPSIHSFIHLSIHSFIPSKYFLLRKQDDLEMLPALTLWKRIDGTSLSHRPGQQWLCLDLLLSLF